MAPSALLACGEAEPPKPPPLEIPVIDVVARDQPITIEMVGQTSGSADIPIRARVEGVVIEMPFAEGGLVAEGDLLYVIDPSELQAKVVEARGNLAEANTRLAKAKADLERIRPLAEMNAVSQVDLDGARAQFEAAIGSKQAARARLEQAEIELGYTKIHAPIAGRIGISEASVGEFVGREPNPVVLNFVSQTDPIRVRFAIDERRYLMLARRIRDAERAGASVQDRETEGGLELILADGSVHAHRGRMVARAAAVDPETGTFAIEADFPNPEEIVLAGQFARIRAVVDTREGAVLVPQRSISELQGLFRIYTVDAEGRIELRPVELGPKLGSLQIVESGLQAGERVAVDIMRLQPGMLIAPKPMILDAGGAITPASGIGGDAEGEVPAKGDVGA
jgi:membrane fusion protein (multidrug efflux system)